MSTLAFWFGIFLPAFLSGAFVVDALYVRAERKRIERQIAKMDRPSAH